MIATETEIHHARALPFLLLLRAAPAMATENPTASIAARVFLAPCPRYFGSGSGSGSGCGGALSYLDSSDRRRPRRPRRCGYGSYASPCSYPHA